LFHDLLQPLAVGGEAAVVFDDDVDAVLVGEVAEARKAIGGSVALLLVATTRVCVNPYRMAAEELGRGDPTVVVLDRLLAGGLVGVAEVPFAIAHNKEAADLEVVAPCLELFEVLL